MKPLIQKVLLVILVLIAVGAGYSFGVGYFGSPPAAQAHALTMPAQPHILYLAPDHAQRGSLTDTAATGHGATPVQSWEAAQAAGHSRAVDAMLIDAVYIGAASPSDFAWLRTLYRQGVVMVGLGVDDDQFAQSLGLNTFRHPGEAIVPLGETGYRLTMTLTLGDPSDLAVLGDWLGRYLQGNENDYSPPGIQNFTLSAYSSTRGSLDTPTDVSALFVRIAMTIEETYNMRARFAREGQSR